MNLIVKCYQLILLSSSLSSVSLLVLLLFQTHKAFIHPHNTDEDIFNETLRVHATNTLTLQKVNKQMEKIIHFNWTV